MQIFMLTNARGSTRVLVDNTHVYLRTKRSGATRWSQPKRWTRAEWDELVRGVAGARTLVDRASLLSSVEEEVP